MTVSSCRAPKPVVVPPVTLTVACPDGPARRLLQQHSATWAAKANVTLKFVLPDAGVAPAADICVLPAVELPHWAEAGKLLALDDKGWSNLLAPYRTHLLRWDNTPYALPLIGDAALCVYRADLYQSADVRHAYQAKLHQPLKPPETWDDFAAQAAFFADLRQKPSLPPLPLDEAGVDRLFFSVAAPYAMLAMSEDKFRHERTNDARASAVLSFQYDAATGRPRVADPGFVAALQLLQRLQPFRVRSGDCVAALKDDQAVLGIVTLRELAALPGNKPDPRWGVCRVPGRRAEATTAVNFVPYIGASALVGAVTKDSSNAAAALDLLTSLTSDTVSLEIVYSPAFGSGPFRALQIHDPQKVLGWFNYGLSQEQTDRLVQILRDYADPTIVNAAYVLRFSDQASHRRVLVEAVRKALTENADAATTLAEVAKRWQELDGDAGKARAVYRKSLGL